MVEPSLGTTIVFVAIVVFVVTAFLVGVARTSDRALTVRVTIGAALWLAITGWASGSGVLERQILPPPVLFFLVGSIVVVVAVASSSIGRRLATLPIAALVAVHGFRLPLELVLHEWFAQGVLPMQMTYSGHNFDIVSGVLAIAVGLWLWRSSPARATARRVVLAFNVVALGLLATVATIAVLSAPLPIRQYMNEPAVLLAFNFPYGWIVPFLVGGALLGHIVLFRWLKRV